MPHPPNIISEIFLRNAKNVHFGICSIYLFYSVLTLQSEKNTSTHFSFRDTSAQKIPEKSGSCNKKHEFPVSFFPPGIIFRLFLIIGF